MLGDDNKIDKIKKFEGTNYKMPFYTFLDVVITFFQKLLYKFYKENYVIKFYLENALILQITNRLVFRYDSY